MFKPSGLYRHVSCLDIDLAVLKVSYRSPTHWKMKVAYVLRSNGAVLGSETVRVAIDQWHLWKRIG